MKKYKIMVLILGTMLLTSCSTSHTKESRKNVETVQIETSHQEGRKAELKKILQEKTESPICEFFYIEDPTEEDTYAFAFTGEKSEEIANTAFQGSLWYVDGQDCILLKDNIQTSRFEPVIIENENHLLFQIESNSPDDSKSYIWAVNNHTPHSVLETSGSCFIDNDLLAMVKTSISNSAGRRIWQRYYLYWDSDKQSYQTYMGREITKEEFLSYENAWETRDKVESAIKDEITRNYKSDTAEQVDVREVQYNYIKCDNGIIYVNYIITCDSDVYYYYSILREKDGRVNLEEREHYDMYENGYLYWHRSDYLY